MKRTGTVIKSNIDYDLSNVYAHVQLLLLDALYPFDIDLSPLVVQSFFLVFDPLP